MANPERGEVDLTLGGVTYLLRPSYEAMRAIERQTGKTLLQLSVSVAGGRYGGLTLDEMGIILLEGIKAGVNPANDADKIKLSYSAAKLAEIAYSDYMATNMALERFLVNAISGGKEPKKEKKSETDQTDPSIEN